jgi:hypothetical protein
MNALIPFPARPDDGMPPARRKYARHMAELAAISRAIIERKAERTRLEAHVTTFDGAQA